MYNMFYKLIVCITISYYSVSTYLNKVVGTLSRYIYNFRKRLYDKNNLEIIIFKLFYLIEK